jgi:UDP-N-acetylglucosamine--dolichyl-phosphate N-acetylglucosaminephosphotransferase
MGPASRGRGGRTALPLLLASALASFLATYLFLPWLIRNLRGTTAVGKDLNKPGRPLVPEMGGLGVILGFYAGVSVVTVLALDAVSSPFYYAALTAALGAGVVGLMDDLFGLRQRMKALLPFLLAVPLGAVVYASGDVTLLGVNLGFLMVLAVPLGVTSAANVANMLEGFNGLGGGLLLIIASALVVLSFLYGAQEGLFLLFPLVGALAAFLWFNRYPAKVFPGDSMTLFAGAAIACAAIISSPPLKTYGVLLFTPMIVEFVLKARGRFRGENYGRVGPDGRLRWEGRIESLAHAVMRWRRPTERGLVITLLALQGLVAALVVAFSWQGRI